MRLLFVCVLYGVTPEASPAVSGLMKRVDADPDFEAIVWDNTPGLEAVDVYLHDRVRYVAKGNNLGLPPAYNFALSHALASGFGYLGLLDQDSTVGEPYLSAIPRAIEASSENVVAWVPRVHSRGQLTSPYTFNRFGLPRYAFDEARCFAINSFSVFSTAYLAKVGGFDAFYWLDALDSRTFAQIQNDNRKCGLIPVDVQHRLSLHESSVNPIRLNSIAMYEAAFFSECLRSQIAISGAFARLLYRGFRKLILSGHWDGLKTYIESVGRGYAAGKAKRAAPGVNGSPLS